MSDASDQKRVARGGVYKGWAGIRTILREFEEIWGNEFGIDRRGSLTSEGLRVTAEEYRELDDERPLVFVSGSGRGKTSGLDLRQIRTQGAQLLHVREGKATRIVIYYDRERVFADLGLAPEGDLP